MPLEHYAVAYTFTHQKAHWAHRAIREMEAAQASSSLEDFRYHFTAFLGFLGALRQFTIDRHAARGGNKLCIFELDEKDLYYCACIDLRNVDVHTENVVGKIPIHGFMTIEVDPKGVKPSRLVSSHTHYYVTEFLPQDFAVWRRGKTVITRPTKAAELKLISDTTAVELAQKGLDYFVAVVWPESEKQCTRTP